MLITLVAAGVLAAYLYRRGSGQALNREWGARVGWITGIFVSNGHDLGHRLLLAMSVTAS